MSEVGGAAKSGFNSYYFVVSSWVTSGRLFITSERVSISMKWG